MAEKTVTRVDTFSPSAPALKRVAAYCRVSLETERLLHSLSAQISYYSELIQKTPGWSYAGVYADEFISGTSTKNRSEFQRLMDDCDSGLIDIVLCKSISRFARNTVDLLETVRHLKNIGVEVRFEKENVTNMTADGELMMTLLAVFSQSESESISENSKWGIRKRFQNGTIGTANKHILGYQYDEEKQQYVIIPEEAEIVRLMFELYLQGLSLQAICDELNGREYRTTLGSLFQEASLNNLIHNEIYAGDILRQKTFITDPLTKNKVRNRGQLTQYYYEDAHEAILDRETYALVQEEMKRRTAMLNPTYCFTGKIICGHCGMPYTRKKNKVKRKEYIHWICRSKKETGMTCDSPNFSEDDLKRICAEVLGLDDFNEDVFNTSVRQIEVLRGGDIAVIMSDGEKKVWKNLHLSDFRHKPTCTDAFQNKITCGLCGNTYHRVNSANRWVYWYCVGKKRKSCNCQNRNYADSHLRIITAEIMGTTDFEDAAFEAQVDHITVTPDGLEYHFKDGRMKSWQKR